MALTRTGEIGRRGPLERMRRPNLEKQEDNELRTYTEVELAELLRCSKAVLRKWRRLGSGPGFVKIGRMVRYPADAVEAFVRRHLVDVAPTPTSDAQFKTGVDVQ
jgi:hypothetical protein